VVGGRHRQVVKAMAVIRRPRDGALLVSEHADPGPAGPFHRLLGGHVEFGEYAEATVRREFIVEIGQRLRDVVLLGVVQNIFDWSGGTAHEIVFLYAASFQDASAYEIAEQRIRDENGGTRVIWRSPGAMSPPLYPAGVTDLMRQATEAGFIPAPERPI
jgi:ADP-ribose pyrophosphatase YjhB (NUDIX family)